MILVELNGGIGNQMFQYAAAKSLSLYHKVELKLDITSAENKSLPTELNKRPFDLHYFNISDKTAEEYLINSYTKISIFSKIINRVKSNYKRKIYREPFFHYDPNFFKAGPNNYLKGLWQSEKYFNLYRKEIRNGFSIDKNFEIKFSAFLSELKKQNSISIHIRRGDYLAKVSLDVLGVLPITYYHQAIELIKSKTQNPKFYFFSDDINWIKENLILPEATYVSDEITNHQFEDLYLMSCCQHNIIANSSFSWWGAWLNNNPNKIIIAPKKWFNKGPKDTQDLIPESWITI